MIHPLSRALAATAAFGLVASLSVPAAQAAPPRRAPSAPSSVAFGIQPASKGRPDSRSKLNYSMTPGASARDEVAVVNIGSKPVTVSIYASDATSGTDGSFGLAPAAAKPTGIGSWVKVGGNGTVRVPARTSHGPSFVIVPITLSAPSNASPGDHAGGVVVSLRSTAVSKQGLKVGFDQRVGMRIYARISGPIRAKLAVEKLSFHYSGPAVNGDVFADGTAVVSYRVHNTGNVLLGATQNIAVSSWLGDTVHIKNLPIVPPLLPGSSVDVRRQIPGVFPGFRLTASIHLHPQAPAGASDPKLADVTASSSEFAWPWSLLAALLLVLALLVALAGYVRHHRRTAAAARHSRGRKV